MIKSVVDNAGTEWLLSLNTEKLKKCREELDCDLFNCAHIVEKLLDPVMLVDVLWVICHEQTADRQLTKESFSNRFSGEIFDNAREAVSEALLDFFPRYGKPMLRKTLAILSETLSKELMQSGQVFSDSLDKQELTQLDTLGVS